MGKQKSYGSPPLPLYFACYYGHTKIVEYLLTSKNIKHKSLQNRFFDRCNDGKRVTHPSLESIKMYQNSYVAFVAACDRAKTF